MLYNFLNFSDWKLLKQWSFTTPYTMSQIYILSQGLLLLFHEQVLRRASSLSNLFYLSLFTSTNWIVNFSRQSLAFALLFCTMTWSGFFWPSAFTSFHQWKSYMCSKAYGIHYFIRNNCRLLRLHDFLCVSLVSIWLSLQSGLTFFILGQW